jgi:glycosyltransferase involved in cell wall biosynthesis
VALKVLVAPQDTGNPYQSLLYGAMEGTEVRYVLSGPTGSQTLNLLLAPLELCVARARGFSVLHVHWVYLFELPWATDRPWARRLMRFWFGVWLATARFLGLRIVWTAHNVVPHSPVFDDDEAARRTLVRRCDAVIVHDESVAAEIARFGSTPTRVVPHPFFMGILPAPPDDRDAIRASFGLTPADLAVLFFGAVQRYKGLDQLLDAVVKLPASSAVRLLVVGACADADLRADIERRLAAAGPRVAASSLRYASEEELGRYLTAADAAAFPFRAVTTSGSVRLALSAGLPVLLPDLAGLRGFPDTVAVRYPAGIDGLTAALSSLDSIRQRLPAMGANARELAKRTTWAMAASETRAVFDGIDSGAA